MPPAAERRRAIDEGAGIAASATLQKEEIRH
jgi:hypothetical protein